MSSLELFPDGQKVGVFRGFRDGGMEFHADLTLPYLPTFQNRPMHGQFVLVELDTPDEAILGRIAALSSDGRLSAGSGEEYNIRALQENREVPEDIRKRYLRYRVNIRVLGVLTTTAQGLTFVASLRRLPPAGSAVAFPSEQVLQQITGHHIDGATIGHLALGEYFFGPKSEAAEVWIKPQIEQARVNFPVDKLVSRRSFVFARAGFGKSNLTKLLFSSLYETTPTVEKRQGRHVPVGTVIFDPDGEYFWPDDKGRPGFCDVEGMADHLVVFTSREAPSRFYGSFTAGRILLDIRRLSAADVVGTFLSAERQQQQNVIKMRGLNSQSWRQLVDLVYKDGNDAELDEIKRLLKLDQGQEVEALAARANATRIVKALHDPSSLMLDMLMQALKKGKLCVVDVSQMSSEQALVLSGLILRRIFDHNQDQFTSATPETIPTIAVVEEAQAVLNEKATAAAPYISWVKEGRKYDLGAVLITQQPGSIPREILSQGDNWFLFHLLSSGDLRNVNSANAHFGEDILASLLNEPLPGQGVFWSSAGSMQYPVPLRVRLFESLHSQQDPEYSRPSVETFAQQLRDEMRSMTADSKASSTETSRPGPQSADKPADADDAQDDGAAEDEGGGDALEAIERKAIEALRNDDLLERIKSKDGRPWGGVKAFFLRNLPENLHDRDGFAYRLVPRALDEIFGEHGWESYKHETNRTTWVRAVDS